MLTTLSLLLLAGDSGWQQLSNADGYLLERRPVTNNPYYEYRVTTDTDVGVMTLCDGTYEWGSVSKDHDELKERRLLEDHGDVRVTYDQIATPSVVAPRDLAFTMKRDRRVDGTCRVDFYSTNEKAPPLPKGWVRLVRLTGHWYFEPTKTGTRVTYYVFSDPGGSLPSAFVHGAQREAALNAARKGIRLSREAAKAILAP